jgi:protein-tyrosine phosphatase
MTRVLFVCLGNICRSPTAEATFRALVEKRGVADRFAIDSAGTAGHHAGESAHRETRREAEARGTPITHRARQVKASDFEDFDLLLAMDRQNERDLLRLAPSDEARKKVALFRSYEHGGPTSPAPASTGDLDTPDPWYTGEFARVYDICARASEGLFVALAGSRS